MQLVYCVLMGKRLNPVVEDQPIVNIFVKTEQSHFGILKDVLILVIRLRVRKVETICFIVEFDSIFENTLNFIIPEAHILLEEGLLTIVDEPLWTNCLVHHHNKHGSVVRTEKLWILLWITE